MPTTEHDCNLRLPTPLGVLRHRPLEVPMIDGRTCLGQSADNFNMAVRDRRREHRLPGVSQSIRVCAVSQENVYNCEVTVGSSPVQRPRPVISIYANIRAGCEENRHDILTTVVCSLPEWRVATLVSAVQIRTSGNELANM